MTFFKKNLKGGRCEPFPELFQLSGVCTFSPIPWSCKPCVHCLNLVLFMQPRFKNQSRPSFVFLENLIFRLLFFNLIKFYDQK